MVDKPKDVKFGFLLIAGILTAALALVFFGWLAEEVLESGTNKFDDVVRNTVHSFASPGLTRVMQGFSFLGSVGFVVGMTLLSLALFVYFHRRHAATMLAITMAGTAILDVALKYAFHRPRPVAFFGTSPGTYSFPSGHALGSMCFYGALAVIISERAASRAERMLIYAATILIVGAIGLSRIYLGVHYPSDVIGGYLAATGWVGTVGLSVGFLHRRGAHGPERPASASKP